MKKFTPLQSAKGILTTFACGNYSLAVARLREVKGEDQKIVITFIKNALNEDELAILKRYARDLL